MTAKTSAAKSLPEPTRTPPMPPVAEPKSSAYFDIAAVKPTLKVKRSHPDVQMPKYQTAGAACFDLHVFEPEWQFPRRVYGHTPLVVGTGLEFEVPDGFVMLIYSRSGHGFKHDVRLANCVGVIDSDYRGPIRVKLTADTDATAMLVEHGDRVAQAMLVPVQQWDLVEVDTLSETARGDGGYGSTGK